MLEDVFNEEILKPKKKKKIKMPTLILVAIILLTILLVVVLVAILYFRNTILKVTIDGNVNNELNSILIFQENNKIYMPIKRMAPYFGYSPYNGDYITRSEDETKCYIENDEELVSFTLNSNVLTKVIGEQTQLVRITEEVKEINGELCITADGAQEAFSIALNYDEAKNDITIQTLPYLYNAYSLAYQQAGYLPIEDETFTNKTAILDNMLIVKAPNNYYGVISIQNNQVVLETKYDSIQYQRNTSDFLVSSNNKTGIIKTNKETKLELIYDDIKTITNNNQIYYIVKLSSLYGLLNERGETIIYPEYNQIGLQVAQYKQNGVTNGDILYNTLIPVQRDNKWALFNLEGTAVTDFIYDSLGCPTTTSTTLRTYGVLQIPEYKLIVVGQGQKYNLITLEGKGLFSGGFILDSVYLTISEGKNVYYITRGTTSVELISFLEENGIEKSETAK